MTDVISMNDMLGVASGDKNNMLGKLLYFSLSDLLIDKEKLTELCAGMSIYYAGDRRVSVSDAFKSATGDIKDRIVVKHFGQQQIYRVYCRDNAHTARVLSRELVKETLNRETNQYEKLAKIDELLKQPNCPFVLFIGTRKLVKRREFEEFIHNRLTI